MKEKVLLVLCLQVVSALAGGSGSWSGVRDWPVIPVGVFHLDDGRILGFAALQKDHYSGKDIPDNEKYRTEAAIWDPDNDSFENKDLEGHDVFCPAMTFLPSGDVYLGGGGNGKNNLKVSTFDMSAKSWKRHDDMEEGHWYGTGVATNSKVVIMEGTAGGNAQWIPETSNGFDFSKSWKKLTDASFEDKINTNPAWYPQAHLLSNGKVLISGTTNDMYTLAVSNRGTLDSVGKRNKNRNEKQAWGATTIMYRPGLIMAVGGIEGWVEKQNTDVTSLSRAIIIDVRKPNDIKTKNAASMHHGRGFLNAVLGPDGNIYVFGGHQNGKQFRDQDSILVPEVYNPSTDKWTKLAAMQTPRNYHASAILLKDGRIFVGGGGLCGSGCAANHQDHEIFTPPYLYNSDGSKLVNRPRISSLSASVKLGNKVTITVAGAKANKIKYFMWMRFYSVTHSLSTDQRGFRRKTTSGPTNEGGGSYSYQVKIPSNANFFPRGLYWVYAVTNNKVPSVAKKVKVGN